MYEKRQYQWREESDIGSLKAYEPIDCAAAIYRAPVLHISHRFCKVGDKTMYKNACPVLTTPDPSTPVSQDAGYR
jgi:hypothetical protein